MSEDLHNIDDLFRKALEENTELPSSTVWDNIDKSLDKKKVISISKRYNKLKWAVAILLLFSLGMAMYTLHIRNQNRELVKQSNEGKKMIDQKTQSGIQNKNSFNISSRIVTNKNSSNLKSLDNKGNIHDSLRLVNNNNIDKKDLAANNESDNVNDNERSKISMPSKDKKTISSLSSKENKNVATKNATHLLSNSKPSTNISNETADIAAEVNPNKKQKVSHITGMNKRFSASVEEPGISDENNTNSSHNIAAEKNIDRLSLLPELINDSHISEQTQALQVDKNALANIKTNNDKKLLTSRKPTSLKKNNNSLFSITAFYSPDLVSAKESSDDDHPRFMEEERDQIRKDEKIKFSSTIGLLISYNIGSKLQLESGITYSTKTTDIMPKTIYARPDNNGNINYRFNCSAGYSYITVKSAPMPASGDSINSLSSKNTLNYIGIPFNLKYVFTTSKWSFIPTVGTSFNFLTRGDIATTIQDSLMVSKKVTSNKIQGLKSSYINGMVGFAVQYNLTKALAISFQPTTRFGLTSINNDAPVKTNLNSVGFVTGLVIKL